MGSFRWEICDTRSLSGRSLLWVDFPSCKMGQLMDWGEDEIDGYSVILEGMSLSEGFRCYCQGMRKICVSKKVEIWLYVCFMRHISL